MIEVGKQVRVLSGKRKGEEGTILRNETQSRKIGNQWFSSEVWVVLFPDGDVKAYDGSALEAVEDESPE